MKRTAVSVYKLLLFNKSFSNWLNVTHIANGAGRMQ
jgi:hypothetical protein